MLRGLQSRLKSAWVFPNLTGRSPVNATNYKNRVFAPTLERAEIGDFRWHEPSRVVSSWPESTCALSGSSWATRRSR